MSESFKKVFAKGVEAVIQNSYGQDYDIRSIVKYYPQLIEDYLLDVNNFVFFELLKLYLELDSGRILNEKWIEKLSLHIKDVSRSELDDFYLHRYRNFGRTDTLDAFFEVVISFKDFGIINHSWFEIHDNLFQNRDYDVVSERWLRKIASLAFKENPNKAHEFINSSDFKSLHYKIRVEYYVAFIENGLLDPATARKLRSESSERVAYEGVCALLNNMKLYDDIKTILLQFIDAKHSGIQVRLARNAPYFMLTYMLGFDNPIAKQILEERLLKKL